MCELCTVAICDSGFLEERALTPIPSSLASFISEASLKRYRIPNLQRSTLFQRMLSHPCTTSGTLERCGPISAGIALIHHPVDNVLKALKGHFECPVKLHGIAIQTKFATHVRWSVLPSSGFSPAIVLVYKHREEGNDVLSLFVRNLSIDECLLNKWTIV